jgi:NitT/TauT family transport system permease protein
MKELLQAFSPNRAFSRKAVMTLVTIQLMVIVLLWFNSPWVLLPKPGEVWESLGELYQQGLPQHLVTSFFLNLESIGIASVLSLGLAYLTVMPFFRPVVVVVSKLRFLSMAGLTFFFTVVTSNGYQLKIALLVFSVSVFFVTSMADVIASIPKEEFDLARTLRMGEWRVVWEVIILGQTDKAFDVLRQNAAIGWMMLTMVEGMVRDAGGIGTVLLDQNHHFHLSAVFAIQLTILVLGLFQDFCIGALRRMFCPYADLTLERK